MRRIGPIWVMMRNRFGRDTPTPRERRIKDGYARSGRQYLRRAEIPSEAVKYSDQIGLVEGAQPPLPCDQPARLPADLKARPNLAH